MEKIIVEIVCLVVCKRLLVHLDAFLESVLTAVLGSDEIAFTRIAEQSLGSSPLTLALEIYRSGVKVVHAVAYCIVDKFIDRILIYDFIAVLILDHLPAHTAIAQERDLVTTVRIRSERHSFRYFRRF